MSHRTRILCALALAAGASQCAKPPQRHNVLLIAVDTLRPDHLGCYGYERPTSPHIDALAAEGIRFTHAQSPRAKTTPAMASVLTGLYPHDHGVRDLTTPLAPDVPTIAEQFVGAGYRTAAVIGNFVLQKERSGLARGFQTWVEDLPQTRGVPPDDVPERTAESLTDEALARLGLGAAPGGATLTRDERPWFLWLHYMDPHGLYDPPAEHRLFTSDAQDPIPKDAAAYGRFTPRIATYNVPAEAWLPDGRVDAYHVRDLYDAEIHYVDAQIGRLLDEMRRAGLLATTWVVFVGDHGESLGEHAYWFEHGAYAYEATCRVPLIVRPPDGLRRRPAPAVRHGDVSLADLGPTILQLCGVPPGKRRGSTFRGRSRAGLLQRDSTDAHPVFSEKVDRLERSRAVQTKTVRIGDWKLLRRYVQRPNPNRPEGGELELHAEELYDLARSLTEVGTVNAFLARFAP